MPNTEAIRFAETGGPEVLQITEVELAEPGPGQALVGVYASGVNFIDTARNYGESERIVGQTLKQWQGERPFIASKVKPRDVGNWRFYVPLEEQFTPESIRKSVETSLRTLNVDCIDLMQLHQWYYLWGQRLEWIDTLQALQSEGKIKYIGVSAQDHEHDAVLKLIDEETVDAVQIFMNAFESRPFVSAIPLCEQHKVGVIARCIYDHSGSLAVGGD
ncbi:MAG: aldo/keto reductase, partial [Acidimicrobiales bacterium]